MDGHRDLWGMAKRKRTARRVSDAIERAAKREAQKAAGALDGRYRPRVVESRKRYSRKRPPPPDVEQ